MKSKTIYLIAGFALLAVAIFYTVYKFDLVVVGIATSGEDSWRVTNAIATLQVLEREALISLALGAVGAGLVCFALWKLPGTVAR